MEDLQSRFLDFGIQIEITKTEIGAVIAFPQMKETSCSLLGRISGNDLTLYQKLGDDIEPYNLGPIQQLKNEQILVLKCLYDKMLKNSGLK